MDFVDTLLHQIYLSMIMDTQLIRSFKNQITHPWNHRNTWLQTLCTSMSNFHYNFSLYIYNDYSYRNKAYFKNLKSSCPLRSYAYRSVSEQQYRCCSVKSKSTRFTQLPPTSFKSRLKLKYIHWKIILISSLVNFCWKKLWIQTIL